MPSPFCLPSAGISVGRAIEVFTGYIRLDLEARKDTARTAATQSFRPGDHAPKEEERPAPSLPRSSVFRKRK